MRTRRPPGGDNCVDLQRHVGLCLTAYLTSPARAGACQQDSSTAIIDAPVSSRKRNTFISARGYESSPRMIVATRDHNSPRASGAVINFGSTPQKCITSRSWSANIRRAAFKESGVSPTRRQTVPSRSVQVRSLEGCGQTSALSDTS